MRTSIFKVESKFNIKYVVLETPEGYISYALRSAMQSIFIARGKKYDVARVRATDENSETVRVSSISELMQWAISVVFTHKVPVFRFEKTESNITTLLFPDTLKLHIDVENELYCPECWKNIFTITNDAKMFHVDKGAIAEWVLRKLNEHELKQGGDVHDTEDYKPLIYTSKFKLEVVRRKHGSGALAGFDEFKFYKVEEHKVITGYKETED